MALEKVTMCDPKEIIMERMHFVINVRLTHWNPMRPSELQIVNGSYEIRQYPITDESRVRSDKSQKLRRCPQ